MSTATPFSPLSLLLDARGLSEVSKNPKLSKHLTELLAEFGYVDESKQLEKSRANAFYNAATQLNSNNSGIWNSHKELFELILSGGIRTQTQVDAAVKYFKKSTEFNSELFKKSCGVGIVVTENDIKSCMDSILSDSAVAQQLSSDRYQYVPKVYVMVLEKIPWADGSIVRKEFESRIEKLLGPKTEEDNAKKSKPVKEKAEKKSDAAKEPAHTGSLTGSKPPSSDDWLDSISGRELPEARNTAEQLKKYMSMTGGKTITRFPPEPNGFLHIGHAKAMNFNFGLASKSNGECIMRFDDTNPEAEKVQYIENILENVHWLGHKPARVTYSSDYFPQLYDLAVKLIRIGKAYVDHQTAAEIKSSRDSKIPSQWRDRPIEESIKLFEDMRKGKFAEGAATLRMKGDLNAANPQMWDVVAYRIKFTTHPHCGDQWCIYPSYDYSHCIIDSLEWISHSCCTLEFEVRRESYFWLLNELELYKPKVWEYSRLNIQYTVMSKRRLLKLVNENIVSGWDDPRMPTINGLRRRGFTPESINDFCATVGVTRNQNMIPLALLEHCIRQRLEDSAVRSMAVIKPLKIILTNYPADKIESISAPNFPKDESRGFHSLPFTRVVYIDSDDFRLSDSKDYYGFAPNKEVHLKYAYNILCKNIVMNKSNPTIIDYIEATVDLNNSNKVKGNIHWVAEPRPGQEPLKIQFNLYETLFKSEDPGSIDDWLNDLNPNSLTTCEGYGDPALLNAKPLDKFQFERVAFFVCDLAKGKNGIPAFNRTVALKESKPKDAPKAAAAAPAKESKKKTEKADKPAK